MTLSSCLHDLEDFTGQFSSVPNIVELSEASNASTGTVTREIINPTVPASFALKVNLAVVSPLSVDTKVTLALDNSLITAYNTAKGVSAVPVPDAALTVSSYTVTIPAGKREVDWSFTIDANKVPNSLAIIYILPVKIVSAENNVTVSGNYGTKLVRVLARNKYDGVYTVTGTLVDLSTGTITGNYPTTVNLVTTTSTQCSYQEPAAAPWGTPPIFHTIKSAGALSVYGSFGLLVNFDASDNVSSVINYYGQPASNTRSAQLDPSGVNKYDGTAKKITIKYWMLQPSVMTAAPYIRTTYDEVWTYVGPR